MALTERQKQIKDLLQQGKRAEDIGKELEITTNAVYQQIRRMRAGGAKVSTPTGGGNGAKAGRKSGGKGAKAKPTLTPSAPAPAAPQATVHQPTTPLQAVRARRDEIHAHTRKAKGEVEAAERALTAAKAQAEKVEARFKEELKSLDKAEAALRPQPPAAKPAPKPAAAKKSGGKKASPPKPAAAAPPAEAPTPPAPADPPAEAPASANGNGAPSAPESAPQAPAQEQPAAA